MMLQILKRSAPALKIQAGAWAHAHILKNGLHAADVDTLPGAAGGPKGLGLQGLDQAIFDGFLAQAPRRRTLIGSSIGAWRFASILAQGAKQGTAQLAEQYMHLQFEKQMSVQQISAVSQTMLQHLIQGYEQRIVQHPDYHLAIIAVKAKHLFQSDRRVALAAALAGIVGSNALGRQNNRWFMQRIISQPATHSQFKVSQDQFNTQYHALNEHNVMPWLMASGSIPGVMAAVNDIPEASGCYRDGGLIDYHLDLDFNSQGLVLYPHFSDHIIPGWFDKMLKRRARAQQHPRTVLISPSAQYLSQLPLGRLPDRKDFVLKGLDAATRIKHWQRSIAESQRLGDEFLTLVDKQNWGDVLEHL